jgi:hypothetical protein
MAGDWFIWFSCLWNVSRDLGKLSAISILVLSFVADG